MRLLCLNQTFANIKSESSSILHLTCIMFLPGLIICLYNAKHYTIAVLCTFISRASSTFPSKQLPPLHTCSPKAIPAVPVDTTLTYCSWGSGRAQANKQCLASAAPTWTQLAYISASLKTGAKRSKQSRNTKLFSQLSQLSASSPGSYYRAHQKEAQEQPRRVTSYLLQDEGL